MSLQLIYSESMRVHNGHVTDADAQRLTRAADELNRANSGGFCCCTSDGATGSQELLALFREHPDTFDPGARSRVERWLAEHRMNIPLAPVDIGDINEPGSVDRLGKTLVKERASNRTWHCEWFPMARRANAPGITLYEAGGPCDLYDQITGKKSVGHELANHQGGGLMWAGHCDMAARICSLLPAPQRVVMYQGKEFTPAHIQGLLVMVSNDLAADNEPFLGTRNNGNPGDDASEPYPHVLMPELTKWAKSKVPYVLDIDPGTQVWNYAFDETEIKEFDSPQGGLQKMPAMRGGKVKYQTWKLHGTGYDAQTRNYRSWIEYASDGKMLASGWYNASPDGKNNPDFAWQPRARGDLMRKENWPTACSYNPEIDPQVVFEIYKRSI